VDVMHDTDESDEDVAAAVDDELLQQM